MSDEIYRECTICGDDIRVPNKGLGRAKLAAWESRHQHFEIHRNSDSKESK